MHAYFSSFVGVVVGVAVMEVVMLVMEVSGVHLVLHGNVCREIVNLKYNNYCMDKLPILCIQRARSQPCSKWGLVSSRGRHITQELHSS